MLELENDQQVAVGVPAQRHHVSIVGEGEPEGLFVRRVVEARRRARDCFGIVRPGVFERAPARILHGDAAYGVRTVLGEPTPSGGEQDRVGERLALDELDAGRGHAISQDFRVQNPLSSVVGPP